MPSLSESPRPAPRRSGQTWEKMAAYCKRFGVTRKVVQRVGLDQLDRCVDDDARAVLLRMIERRPREKV